MSNKPVLVYYSLDCFIQVDDTVLSHLASDFKVVWFYLYESIQANTMRYNPVKAQEYADKYGITLEVVDPKMHRRNPKNILFYKNLANRINSYNPDIVYACEMFPFWMLTYRYVKCKNKVYGIHDVLPHYVKSGFIKKWILKKKEQYIKQKFDHIVTFSKNQQALLKEHFGKDSDMVGMSCKCFGDSKLTLSPFENGVKILFFGIISHYKGLDLLIQAMEELKKEGVNNLQLTIAGRGESWSECQPLIKSPELYNLQVRFIENAEIPDLMGTHHFIVLPYRSATQSGPLVAALGYGIPVVAPNFGCFTDTVNNDAAILYEQGSLKDALRKVSQMTKPEYEKMRVAMFMLREQYSEESIAANYNRTFKKVLDMNNQSIRYDGIHK